MVTCCFLYGYLWSAVLLKTEPRGNHAKPRLQTRQLFIFGKRPVLAIFCHPYHHICCVGNFLSCGSVVFQEKRILDQTAYLPAMSSFSANHCPCFFFPKIERNILSSCFSGHIQFLNHILRRSHSQFPSDNFLFHYRPAVGMDLSKAE